MALYVCGLPGLQAMACMSNQPISQFLYTVVAENTNVNVYVYACELKVSVSSSSTPLPALESCPLDKSSLFYPDSKKIIYSWLMAFGLSWPVASQNQCLGQSPSSWLPKSEAWAIGHAKPPYGSSLAWLLMPGLGWLLAQSQGREITNFKHKSTWKAMQDFLQTLS